MGVWQDIQREGQKAVDYVGDQIKAGGQSIGDYFSGDRPDNSKDDAAIKAIRAQTKAAEEALAFQKEQFEYWHDIYGDIQQNLSNFYTNLDPQKYATGSKIAQQTAFQNSQTQVSDTLAQRGLGGGRFESYVNAQANFANESTKANIDFRAPEQVAQLKQGFLSLGLGQYQNHLAGIGAAYGNQINAYGQQYTAQLDAQARAEATAATREGNRLQLGSDTLN